MDEKTILQVLADQKDEKAKYNSQKLCHRREEEFFEWDSNLAQVVIGVRRCGKSTLCHKVLTQRKVKYAYVDMNDDRLFGLKTADLNTVLNCVYQLYGSDVNYILLDEIQDVDGWYLFVNRLLRQGMHVVITGSNAKLLSGELATYLTGRYNEIRLFPFSYAETCSYNGIDTEDITTKADASRKAAVTQYVMDGGMPELLSMKNQQSRRTYMGGLIETIITKDIAKRFNIRNVESLRRMTHQLLNNVCQSINYEGLMSLAGLGSVATTQKYTGYLQQAFLIKKVQKFSFKSTERIRNEKVYVIDNGFIANRENSLLGENIGWRLENVVLVELLRRYSSQADDIYFYKPTSRSKEVDFVVCRQGVVVELIQVAYSVSENKTFKRETDALIDAAEKLQNEKLSIVCLDDSRDVEIQGHTIHIKSAIDWLLGK